MQIGVIKQKWIATIGGIDLFIMLLVIFAAPQDSLSAIIGSSILVLTSMTVILLYGAVIFLSDGANDNVNNDVNDLPRDIIVAITLLLPYSALLITGASGIQQFPLFLVWYLLPAVLLLIQNRMDSPYRIILVLLAAALLWIGFDHRYTKYLFEGYSDSYIFNALWMAAVGLSGYSPRIKTETEFDRGVVPSKQGVKIANIVTPLASLIVIPFGLLTHFLRWNPQIDVVDIIIGFIGIFLTIALQEELIFRGIALRELDKFGKTNLSLIVVSALFALTHWNNETPQYVWHYFFAAFVAGIAYGIAYRKGGLFGAMLSHTLVDWVWAIFLKRV